MFKIQGTKNKRVGKLISFLEIQELHNAGGTARSPLLRCLGKDWRGFVPFVRWQWGGAVNLKCFIQNSVRRNTSCMDKQSNLVKDTKEIYVWTNFFI